MFTGIVEATGEVLSFESGARAWRLRLRVPAALAGSLKIGDSLAVNGCCLTLVEKAENALDFDLLEETVRLTGFAGVRRGERVNLERSLAADGRLGGHFVSGHIDAKGDIAVFEPRGNDYYLRVRAPQAFLKYLAYKGSVAVDGVSLTVAETHDDGFAVWLIPHTVSATRFCGVKAGDSVNLEFDLLAKYLERLAAK